MHFTDTYLPRRDGVVTSLRTLRAAQAAAGHDVHCVVPAHGDQEDEPGLLRVPALACGVADLRLARWPLATRRSRERLVADLAAYRPDVVHVHTPARPGCSGCCSPTGPARGSSRRTTPTCTPTPTRTRCPAGRCGCCCASTPGGSACPRPPRATARPC
ncbi:glycosyltransferase [Catellatospora bangladeshensis]|uniref:glycosyltransferase n=1 Tax=Catellatospora bangladeshensis TaxID=310355 RepID=UPI00361F8DC7